MRTPETVRTNGHPAEFDLEADTATDRRVLAVLAYLSGTGSLWLDTPMHTTVR